MFISNLLISYTSLHTKYFSTRHWAGASGTHTYDRNLPSGSQNKKICLKKKEDMLNNRLLLHLSDLYIFVKPILNFKRTYSWDFPGGPMVKSPSCNAGDLVSTPGQESKLQCATQQLSPCAVTREPVCHNY